MGSKRDFALICAGSFAGGAANELFQAHWGEAAIGYVLMSIAISFVWRWS